MIKDDRLYGCWKSDMRLTAKYNDKHAILSAKQREFLLRLFGKVEVVYSEDGTGVFKMPVDMLDSPGVGKKEGGSEYSEDSFKYEILGKNSSCAAVKITEGPPESEDDIFVVHFEDKDIFWVYLSSLNIREYFRRDTQKSTEQQA